MVTAPEGFFGLFEGRRGFSLGMDRIWVVSEKSLTPGGSPQSQVLAVFSDEGKAWDYFEKITDGPIKNLKEGEIIKFRDLQVEGPFEIG